MLIPSLPRPDTAPPFVSPCNTGTWLPRRASLSPLVGMRADMGDDPIRASLPLGDRGISRVRDAARLHVFPRPIDRAKEDGTHLRESGVWHPNP